MPRDLSSIIPVALMMGLAGSVGCGKEISMGEQRPLANQEWQAAAQQRVVFGHQSVGENILEGVRALAAEQRVALDVVESRANPGAGSIIHFKIGENGQPVTKIEDFRSAIEFGAANGMDVAMMKLCYLDFAAETDAVTLAQRYIALLEELQESHPGTRFVAITAPLTTVQTGPKAWAKRVLGRAPAGYETNLRRWEFNEKVRARFADTGQLFDLARIESGSSRFEYRGHRVESLQEVLTSDGGHLNDAGRRLVASAFVRFLAEIGDIGD